jgi:hypothetical protein
VLVGAPPALHHLAAHRAWRLAGLRVSRAAGHSLGTVAKRVLRAQAAEARRGAARQRVALV